MKKLLITLLFIFILLPCVFSEFLESDIFLSDIPITYGDELFRTRILEQTEGKRDPVGLVLSGGSARAFAHIGVIRYFEEINFKPDFIVTNSMGSIIGLMYSAGMKSDQMIDVILSADPAVYFKITQFLEGGLIDASGFESMVLSIIGEDADISTFDIPIIVACEDLVTLREIRMAEGSLSNVLMASFALPVYFAPVEYKGHLLVDGGIASLVPVEIAKEYSDTIIVSTTFYDNPELNLRNPITNLNSAINIGKTRTSVEDLKTASEDTILIRSAVEDFSFMQFSAVEELANLGYEAAKAEGNEILNLSANINEANQAVVGKYDANISKTVSFLENYNRVPNYSTSLSLALNYHSYQERNDYLHNSFDFGEEFEVTSKYVDFSILLGGSTQLLRQSDYNIDLALNMNLDIYPLSCMKISLFAVGNVFSKSIYAAQSWNVVALNKDDFKLGFNQQMQYKIDFTTGIEDKAVLSAHLNSFYSHKIFNFSLDVGYLFIDFNSHYFDAAMLLEIYYVDNAFIDIGLSSRALLDSSINNQGTPLFLADGYYTNTDLYSANLNQDYFVLVPISIGYNFDFNPALAEMFMISDFSIAAYCNALFFSGTKPGFNTGLEIEVNFSLIEMQDLPINFKIGYDSLANDYIASIKFALEL